MKLKSGIRVSVQESEASKFLLFERPVRIIELTREESIKLGSFLLDNARKEKGERGK